MDTNQQSTVHEDSSEEGLIGFDIVKELEQDLMTIAVNMSHEIDMSEKRRDMFLKQVERYLTDLNIVFMPENACKCRMWHIKQNQQNAAKVIDVRKILKTRYELCKRAKQ